MSTALNVLTSWPSEAQRRIAFNAGGDCRQAAHVGGPLSRAMSAKEGTSWSGELLSAKDGATPRPLEYTGRFLGNASSSGHRVGAVRPARRRDQPPPGTNAFE